MARQSNHAAAKVTDAAKEKADEAWLSTAPGPHHVMMTWVKTIRPSSVML
jgi:hypothetical protein